MAARLVTQGYAGMISGHTHEPELSVVGNGFYANTGSGTASVVSRRARRCCTIWKSRSARRMEKR